MSLEALRQDPRFRELGINDQLRAAQYVLTQTLGKDPRFSQYNPIQQQKLIQTLSLRAPVFEDETVGSQIRELGYNYATNTPGSGFAKGSREFVDSAISTSGIAGLVSLVFAGESGAVRRADRQRTLEYFKAVESISGRHDPWGEIGSVVGFVGDIAAVNLAMKPLTMAATTAVRARAAGTTVQAFKAAEASGITLPMLAPKLAAYGPIAAESAIEAVPYFLVEESRRRAAGQPTVLSGGVGEVAKTLGINAAADFVVGSALSAVLGYVGRTGQALFRKSDLYDLAYKNADEEAKLLVELRRGTMDPRVFGNLPEITQDSLLQKSRITDYIERGAADPDVYLEGRAALLANDLGRIWGKADDGSYKLWELSKDGKRAHKLKYQSFADLENSLSLSYFAKHKKALDADLDALSKGTEDYIPKSRVRPDLEWAAVRGRTLREAYDALNPSEIESSVLGLFKQSGLKPRAPGVRPIMSKAEADSLSGLTDDTHTVVQTQIPLSGAIIDNANERSLNLLRGQSNVTVKPSDNPNAVIVGISNAPLEVYQAALAKSEELAKDLSGTGSTVTQADALSSLMLNNGFDHVRLPDGTVQFFSTRSLRLIGTPDDLITAVRKADSGSASAQVLVRQQLSKRVAPAQFGKNPEVLEAGAIKALRSGSPDDYREFSRAYLRGFGITRDIDVRTIPGDAVRSTIDGETLRLMVPGKFTSFAEESAVLAGLIKALDDYGNRFGSPGKALKQLDYAKLKFNENPLRFGFPSGVDPTSWVEVAAASLGGKLTRLADGFQLDLPYGSVTVSSIDDAVNLMAKRTMDPSFVRNDLLAQGARLVNLPSGRVQIRSYSTGKLLADGADLPSALDAMGWVPRTISSSFAPTDVSFTPDGFRVQWYGSKVFKDWSSTTKFLSKFEDQAEAMRRKLSRTNGKGQIFETPARQFEVYVPRYDVWQRFDNVGDANKFLATDVRSLDELKAIADKKLLDLSVSNGVFTLRSPDGRVVRATSQSELAQAMRDYPDVEKSVRSVFSFLDPSTEASISEIADQWRKSAPQAGMNKFGRPPEFELPDRHILPAYASTLGMTEQKTALMEFLAQKSNDPVLLRKFRTVEDARRASELESRKSLRVLDTMFRDDSGKIINKESRQKIFYHLAADNAKETQALAEQQVKKFGKLFPPLTPTEQRIAESARQYLDAMSTHFGIPFDRLIFRYMPMLRDLAAESNSGLVNNMVMADSLVKAKWGDKPPAELKFFAEFERTDEILNYTLKDDALEVLMLYTAQGNKKLYMNDAWKQLADYTNTTKPQRTVILAIDNYREQLMGSHRSTGERFIEDFGEQLFRGIKRSPLGKLISASDEEMASMGRNILSSTLGLTYVSSMGWKPFLAIRNSFQGWVTAAPRLGPDWVARGWKALESDIPGEIKRLRDLGVISEKPPIVNQVFSHSTKVGRFAEKSLEWLKNSDDMTRAWTYKSAELKFQNAVDAYAQGKITTQEAFSKLSGLSRMDPVMGEDLWKLVQTKDPRAYAQATHNFALKFTDETMFGYRATEAPLMFQGAVGKAFGQFGTYSAAFRANLARMFAYGSTAEKIEMVSTYLALTSALWGTFTAFKIKTNDFVPFAPALFTGGPMFDMGLDAIKSGDPGYEGDQARARLKTQLPTLLPGSAQIRYLKKSAEYYSQGDSYRGWLSLTATPVLPE